LPRPCPRRSDDRVTSGIRYNRLWLSRLKTKDNAMGEGIRGAIPITFCFAKEYMYDRAENKAEFQEYAATDFFDFYNETMIETHKHEIVPHYTIKPEILLPNFKDFFLEFHDLIQEMEEDKFSKKFNKHYDKAVASGNIESFLKHFDDDTGRAPLRMSHFDASYIDVLGDYLLVYHGSYKAYLEVWSTLRHMELMLRAAMRNPLAKIVRFGII